MSMLKLNEIKSSDKPDASLSSILTFIKGNNPFTIIMPNCDFEILRDNESCVIIIHFTIDDMELGKYDNINYDITNDPCLPMAGGVISLGYHAIRMSAKDASLVNINPITIKCDYKNLTHHNARPLV